MGSREEEVTCSASSEIYSVEPVAVIAEEVTSIKNVPTKLVEPVGSIDSAVSDLTKSIIFRGASLVSVTAEEVT